MLCAVSVILVFDLFLSDKRRGVTYLLSLMTLLGCAIVTAVSVKFGEVVFTFNGMYVDDALSDLSKIFIYIAISTALVYSRQYLKARDMYRGEFYTLTLFATLGMMVMVSASHFLTLYMGLELLSLSLYALVALQRDSVPATEAAIKYFVLGALASGLLLYGISMIYGATGTLNLKEVAHAISTMGSSNKIILVFGLVFVVAGLGFKLGAVPFHMWVPDVYHGSPTAVTMLLGSAPKVAAFVFVFRFLVNGMQGLLIDWQGMLIILAVLSMAVGNIAAIAQTNLKRMLAYSAISHMGFMLLGIISGNANGYSSAFFYVAVYVIMSLGGFGMIAILSRAGFEADRLEDFKGLNRRHPWFAFLMLLFMFSMAGVPPTVGFYAKLAVVQSILEVNMIALAIASVMFSLIGAFYYLRIVKLMYFDEPVDESPITSSFDVGALMTVNGAAILVLGIMPQPLMGACLHAIQTSL